MLFSLNCEFWDNLFRNLFPCSCYQWGPTYHILWNIMWEFQSQHSLTEYQQTIFWFYNRTEHFLTIFWLPRPWSGFFPIAAHLLFISETFIKEYLTIEFMQSVLSVVVLVFVVLFIIGIIVALYFLANYLFTYLIKYYRYRKKESELKNIYPYSYYILGKIQEKRQNPLILHNLLREYVFQNIKRTAFHQAMGTLEQHLKETKYPTESRIYEIPSELIRILKENVEGDCPFFLWHEIQEDNIPDYVCHYKLYKDFWNYCIRKTSEFLLDTNQIVRKNRE